MGSILLLARVVLAAVFGVAGIAKSVDLDGSRKSLRDFGVPGSLARPFALLLPLAELICAGALLFDSSFWWGATGVAVLLILFMTGIAVSLARGRKPDCHCFGQLRSEPVGVGIMVRNALLLGLAGLVIWAGRDDVPGAITALSAAAVFTVALMLWFSIHALRHPPARRGTGQGLAVGAPAPDFKLKALEGGRVSLVALSSEDVPLMLVFVEPYCPACDALLPRLAEWQSEHAGRLRIVPITSGDRKPNRAKFEKYGVRGALLQQDREVAVAYDVNATPCALIVTRGTITTAFSEGAEEIRKLVRRVFLPPPAKKGDTMPSLRLPDLDGATVDLAYLRGRRTLLLFWSTACPICRQMLEDVKRWECARPDNAPGLLVISSGTPEANRRQGFLSPVLLDANGDAAIVLGVVGTPSAVILDQDGKVASEVRFGPAAVLELAGAHANQ